MHYPCEPGGAGLLSPLAEFSLKTEPWPILIKLTGDLSHGEGHLPEDG